MLRPDTTIAVASFPIILFLSWAIVILKKEKINPRYYETWCISAKVQLIIDVFCNACAVVAIVYSDNVMNDVIMSFVLWSNFHYILFTLIMVNIYTLDDAAIFIIINILFALLAVVCLETVLIIYQASQLSIALMGPFIFAKLLDVMYVINLPFYETF